MLERLDWTSDTIEAEDRLCAAAGTAYAGIRFTERPEDVRANVITKGDRIL